MPRNKYPEETRKKIVDTAFKLFTKKGYENTSVQDIIDETGLSKGAIYHHFDSKEAILLTVYETIHSRTISQMLQLVHSPQLNGCEKLKAMFFNSFRDKEHIDFISSMPGLLDNSHFLALYMKMTMEEVAPHIICPILQEGIADGSIKCEHPLETAQAIMALSNIWMNPLIYADTGENLENKVAVLQQILGVFGIQLADSGLAAGIQNVVDNRKREQNHFSESR